MEARKRVSRRKSGDHSLRRVSRLQRTVLDDIPITDPSVSSCRSRDKIVHQHDHPSKNRHTYTHTFRSSGLGCNPESRQQHAQDAVHRSRHSKGRVFPEPLLHIVDTPDSIVLETNWLHSFGRRHRSSLNPSFLFPFHGLRTRVVYHKFREACTNSGLLSFPKMARNHLPLKRFLQ